VSTQIQYPDGVDIQTSRPKFLPVMLAPELQVPQATGNDLTWVAGLGGAYGPQPITNTSDGEGDYPGATLMALLGGAGNEGGGN
jgi:hypothetical protein